MLAAGLISMPTTGHRLTWFALRELPEANLANRRRNPKHLAYNPTADDDSMKRMQWATRQGWWQSSSNSPDRGVESVVKREAAAAAIPQPQVNRGMPRNPNQNP
ncbi:hypothetical protein OIU77_015603 [Salix suchowensis]|uniref:Uncharacterized protein n=1 Tax=Salix suchowensis TaxID=1278906 RepID=A0ABQ8ZHT9_9ROSI|nr:hypothetical protein OIU77_015603 [Salix suchowensis]